MIYRIFFCHENQKCPAPLSQNSTLNSTVKSQLLGILELAKNISFEEPETDTEIIDGAALVNAKPSRAVKTVDEYEYEIIIPHIESHADRYSRTEWRQNRGFCVR